MPLTIRSDLGFCFDRGFGLVFRSGAVTRQKLYGAAVTLIAEQGLSATTVDDIAKGARVAERAAAAKGTVSFPRSPRASLPPT
jgi:hypothetical protein